MNSHTESVQLDIKHEENSRSITEVKIEPQDIKYEMKKEVNGFEHTVVKQEINPILPVASSMETELEVDQKQDILEVLLTVSEDKSQYDCRNAEEEINCVPVVDEPFESYRIDVEEKCDVNIYGNTGEKANLCSWSESSFFEQNILSKCVVTTDKRFKCNICNRCFPSKHKFTTHVYDHVEHTQEYLDSALEDCQNKLQGEEKNREKDNTFFPRVNGLHETEVYMEERPSPKMCRSTVAANRFTCDICTKSFTKKCNLTSHINLHTCVKRFFCNFCSKSFSRRYDLSLHTRSHKNEKFFTCNICSVSFSVKRNLSRHLITHTNDKPFICNICNKSFALKYNLTRHKLIHTNEKPYSCGLCSKSFIKKYQLSAHVITHTIEKPFMCDICCRAFALKCNLVAHTIIHTNERPFACDLCSMSFARKSVLINHTRSHKKEKPFICTLCMKSFSRKDCLKKHLHSHTRSKPFTCNQCCKSFSFKCSLNDHMHKHMG